MSLVLLPASTGMRYCEAMVLIHNGIWTRCGRRPTELHHRLTRARGGLILDKAGETYHLMNLCHSHHMVAHDQGQAFESGLLIDGYVITGRTGPTYTGTDRYLSEKYGGVEVPEVQEVLEHHQPGPHL